MSVERVRLALDVSMEDDPETQKELATYLGLALVDAAVSFGVDLGRSSSIIVTRSGGETHREVITDGGS